MSFWGTKSYTADRNYIVIQHPVKGVNTRLLGVIFRGGYAVIEKNSKTYSNLKKISVLKNFKEFPLDFLRKLPFITRTIDIKTIYGQDVYSKYITLVTNQEKEQQLQDHLDSDKCRFTTESEKLCGNFAVKDSPSKYCLSHILEDPELEINAPKMMPKKDRRDWQKKVANNITKYLKKKE